MPCKHTSKLQQPSKKCASHLGLAQPRKCHHQKPAGGLKMPNFACKSQTAAEAAGCMPTTLGCPMLELINDVLSPCMQCSGCNTLKQQLPAQKQQGSKPHRQQHSRTPAEQKHQPHTHSRGMQPELPACLCSKREGLLIYCCGCGLRLRLRLRLRRAREIYCMRAAGFERPLTDLTQPRYH
jgi:hypothetical protein